MADSPPPSPEELARQLGQHVQSLQAAGVQYVPRRGEAPARLAPAQSQAGEQAGPVLQPSLFDTSLAEAPAADGPEQRRHELTVLAQHIAGCTRCDQLVVSRSRTVFGVGPLDPELCFVGEGPGATEDQLGEPFVGEAGQLLNRIIAACGLKREEVYICNIVKCRPPGNRTPLPVEAGHCREYLERQLELVRPRFLCALGTCAAQNLLGSTASIGRLRGRFHDYRGIPVMCTYHPAFLLPNRSPHMKKVVWEDMQKLLARMGRTIPGRQ
jgi:DNA polymerase